MVAGLAWGLTALGQGADGGVFESLDASLPDASVGMGGADMTSEENDVGGPCVSSRECVGATSCVNGRCVPRPTQDVGCGAAPVAVVPLAGTWAAWRSRRRRAPGR